MAENKTQKNTASVPAFIDALEDENKKADSRVLLKLFKEITGEKPMMWGASIIGFGSYHYQSLKSKQSGDWFLTGFSPRKQQISIYIIPGMTAYKSLLAKLGKHTVSSGSCLYIKKLADVDLDILKSLIATSYKDMKEKNP